ncbi:hypothetical protein B0H12DRAFT_1072128 [Mycena haematopus]|nr:hypothetical protein B0H12DRAFT_1072128 [Mycena haematopus]
MAVMSLALRTNRIRKADLYFVSKSRFNSQNQLGLILHRNLWSTRFPAPSNNIPTSAASDHSRVLRFCKGILEKPTIFTALKPFKMSLRVSAALDQVLLVNVARHHILLVVVRSRPSLASYWSNISNFTEIFWWKKSNVREGVIYLYYFMYTTTSTSVGQYFIDDRDWQITYTPPWTQYGFEVNFQHTSQASSSVEDFITFQSEGGQSVFFYRGVTIGTQNASVVLDAKQQPNLQFDQDLSRNHTLVVTAENDQLVWAHYFLVTPNPPSLMSPSSSSSSSASSSTGTLTPSLASHKSKPPVGAIVGPVVGVLALT